MRNSCLHDVNQECTHTCPQCSEYIKTCSVCGASLEDGD